MRILFVAPGGAVANPAGVHMPFVQREAEALRAAGHEVQVLGFDNRSYLNFFSEWRKLRAAVARSRPDILHAQFGKFTALMAAFAGAPLVITFRGTDINRNTKYSILRSVAGITASQVAAFFARGIVCVSGEMRSKVWARRWRPTIVLPTGVDLKLFRPMDRGEARRKLGYAAHERVVLFNASKNPDVKDPALAQAAVNHAAARMDNIRFVVLDGTARPQDIPLYMNAADVLLLTSRTEGSPTVVQEAMACNLPVVSVDVGDVRERLEGVEQCAVVRDREPASLAAELIRVLHNGQRSDGRRHAAALGIGSIAARLAEFYRAVAGASTTAQPKIV